MATTRGVLYVHSAPAALCPHIEWAAGSVFGVPVTAAWSAQPAELGSFRAELSWSAKVGTAARLASALTGWQRVRFEVTEEPTPNSEGCRYSYTPTLGAFHAVTGLHGDIMVAEDRLKRAVTVASLGGESLTEGLQGLLGTAWDAELESFRFVGEDAEVRWLQVV